MTQQINDTCLYKRKTYDLVSEDWLISAHDLGITAVPMGTACFRGFYSHFSIVQNQLMWREFHVSKDDGDYPIIDGIKPKVEHNCACYKKLDRKVPFTGELTLYPRSFIPEAIPKRPEEETETELLIVLTFESGVMIASGTTPY